MQFKVFDLGLIDFNAAWNFQKEVFLDVRRGSLKSALILCNHHPVITIGKMGKKENLNVSGDELKKRKISVFQIERAGDVTYHGPGQITIYPVFNLSFFKKDIHFFLRQLESIVISFLSDMGIEARRYSGLTGVWVENILGKQKIASIGIAIKNWITFHGLSINIKKDDLDNFRLIRPCGMDIEMTSVEAVLGSEIEINIIKERIVSKFQDMFPILFNEPICYAGVNGGII